MIKSIRTDLDQHAPHLIRSIKVPFLLATCSVALCPVHADAGPSHSQGVDQPRMLSDLSLDFAPPPSAGTTMGAVPICNASVVLFLPGCNDDGGANNGNSILPLLPLAVHAECGCGGICPTATPSASTCQALARKWHPSRVVMVILPPSSCAASGNRQVFLLKTH